MRNTGTTKLTAIALTDDKLGKIDLAKAALDPGESLPAAEKKYKVVQADLDAKKIINTATASAKDAGGKDVSAKAKTTVATADAPADEPEPGPSVGATGGGDGPDVTDTQFVGAEANKEGIYALLKLEDRIFNLLCVPGLGSTSTRQAREVLPRSSRALPRRSAESVDEHLRRA